MKKFTLITSLFVSACLSAQTFSDNFDSYIAGQKLAQQSGGAWTTWSNAPGGAEDGVVSNANSFSAPNSMYFSSDVQGGGPVDQVRNFGVLNTGQFSMSMNLFVESGKAAYFNLQKTATIGQTWALNANFNDDGTLTLDDASVINLSTTYTQGAWFNFRLDINFNTNRWEVFIDNVSAGYFANSINQIASIDIFPVDQNTPFSSGFYLDDFEYTVTPYILPNTNLAATFVSVTGANLVGSSVETKVKVRNLGVSAITSFDITTNYNGVNDVQSFSSQNIASLAEVEYTLTNPIVLVAGSNTLSASVSNINGNGFDDDGNDDTVQVVISPITPAAGKVVVGEEGTGTWCQWCPRGAVFMDEMESIYGDNWIGIAVHNGDPMTVTDYDAGMGGLISGYPSALVDRGNAIDPSAMESDFLQKITQAPTALISNTATYSPISRTLTVTVSADFQMGANSNYKLACVLTEDGVTGTGSAYSQSNAYAGGGNGVMGGFESLPNPVPAAQMVYDHVARAIQPSFTGMVNSFPATVNAGETHSQTFTFTLAADWDTSEIHIIGLLFDPAGDVDNAGEIDLSEADILEEFLVQCPQAVSLNFNDDGSLMPDFTSLVTNGTTCVPNTVTLVQSPAAGTTLTVGNNPVTFTGTDDCGNTNTCTFNVTYVNNLSVIETNGNTIKFFPNPTEDMLNFSVNNAKVSTIRIISMDGKILKTKKIDALTGTVSLADLKTGIYEIEFMLENGSHSSRRFVKN